MMKQEVKNLGNYINELNATFAKLQGLFEGNKAGRAMSAKSAEPKGFLGTVGTAVLQGGNIGPLQFLGVG